MSNLSNTISPSGQTSSIRRSDLLLLSAWCGLVTGLVEGAGLLLFQELQWLNWDVAMQAVWYDILWISPFFNLLLFLSVGVLAALALPLAPAKWRLQSCFFLFGFLLFLDWLMLSGRIRLSACMLLALGLASVTARWAKTHGDSALRFMRRSLPAAGALAVLVFGVVVGGGWLKERRETARLAPAPGTPNILVIVVDTLRADHLSSYGYTRPTSPHIDELAQQGVLFERAISASSWTLPSHASLLTGQFPHEHGAGRAEFDARSPTISEALRDRGYRTAAFSANTFWFNQGKGFGRGFLHFEDFFTTVEDMALRTVYGRKYYKFVRLPMGYEDVPARKLAADINDSLLRWLERNPDKPFFAFLNYLDTHDPYLPPQPFRSRFSKLPNPGGRINESIGRDRPKLTPEQLQGEIDAYDGAIAYVDVEIGKLMEELKKRGLAENTVVAITSDHGESFGEHGLFVHRNALYRNLIHVPLVLYWPGKLPAGVRISTPVSNVLLPATLAEMAGGGGKIVLPGASLAEYWKQAEPRDDFTLPLAELSKMPFPGMKPAPAFYGAMQSIASREWHYIHNETLGTELFDWERDPQELQNLAKTPEGQKLANEFAARLEVMLGPKPKAALNEPSGKAR